ncbi:hypothetical protein D3C76_819470 [compost metagenome]
MFSESSATFFMSETPACVALISTKLCLVVLAITLAREVFPHPGGPQNIAELSLSAFINLYKSLSFPTICSCPKNSSKLLGRILYASGSISNSFK